MAVLNIIYRGAVVGMSLRLQGFMEYVNHRFAVVFFLYLPVLIGLVVTPGQAASDHTEVGTLPRIVGTIAPLWFPAIPTHRHCSPNQSIQL